eukprot:12129860-Prorocentrum_lima.AAC.1
MSKAEEGLHVLRFQGHGLHGFGNGRPRPESPTHVPNATHTTKSRVGEKGRSANLTLPLGPIEQGQL